MIWPFLQIKKELKKRKKTDRENVFDSISEYAGYRNASMKQRFLVNNAFKLSKIKLTKPRVLKLQPRGENSTFPRLQIGKCQRRLQTSSRRRNPTVHPLAPGRPLLSAGTFQDGRAERPTVGRVIPRVYEWPWGNKPGANLEFNISVRVNLFLSGRRFRRNREW